MGWPFIWWPFQQWKIYNICRSSSWWHAVISFATRMPIEKISTTTNPFIKVRFERAWSIRDIYTTTSSPPKNNLNNFVWKYQILLARTNEFIFCLAHSGPWFFTTLDQLKDGQKSNPRLPKEEFGYETLSIKWFWSHSQGVVKNVKTFLCYSENHIFFPRSEIRFLIPTWSHVKMTECWIRVKKTFLQYYVFV